MRRQSRSTGSVLGGYLLVVAALTMLAAPAVAQEVPDGDDGGDVQAQPAKPAAPRQPAPPARRTPPREPALSFQGFGTFAYTSFTASETFNAVLGTSSGSAFGGGARVSHRSGFFFQFDLSRFSDTGQRVYEYQGEIFELGIPLDVTVTPLELTGGYRFVRRARATPQKPPARTPPKAPTKEPPRAGAAPPQRPAAPQAASTRPASSAPRRPRFIPYAGGGIGFVQYEEESPFAEAGDAVSESFTSYHVLGGVDVPLWRWLGTGVEVNYRWVPDALGEGGVSKAFGETDLGGFTFRVRVTVGQ